MATDQKVTRLDFAAYHPKAAIVPRCDSRRKRGNRPMRYLPIATIAATALLSLWLFSGSPPAEAAVSDKLVYGNVYDLGGQPVIGADVLVEIWGGSWPDRTVLRTSMSTVTGVTGQYEVTIDANYWDPHNTIWVFANDSTYEGETRVEADNTQSQVVDVSLVQVIPEFEAAGVVGVVVSTAGILVTFRRRFAPSSRARIARYWMQSG